MGPRPISEAPREEDVTQHRSGRGRLLAASDHPREAGHQGRPQEGDREGQGEACQGARPLAQEDEDAGGALHPGGGQISSSQNAHPPEAASCNGGGAKAEEEDPLPPSTGAETESRDKSRHREMLS